MFLAPVLPWLTDDEESLDAAIGAIAAAGATGVTVLALHLRPGAREWFLGWLGRAHPELVPRYRQLYGRGAYVPADYREALARRVAPILAAHGLGRQAGGEARRSTGDAGGAFPAGSMPAPTPHPWPGAARAADPALTAPGGQPASRAAACWARTARTTPREATGGAPAASASRR